MDEQTTTEEERDRASYVERVYGSDRRLGRLFACLATDRARHMIATPRQREYARHQ